MWIPLPRPEFYFLRFRLFRIFLAICNKDTGLRLAKTVGKCTVLPVIRNMMQEVPGLVRQGLVCFQCMLASSWSRMAAVVSEAQVLGPLSPAVDQIPQKQSLIWEFLYK